MKVQVFPSTLSGSVEAVSSKSYAIRAIIAAATIANNPVKIYGKFNCDDILSTIDCLEKMGARIENHDNHITVHPVKNYKKSPTLCVNECATAYRFLLPISATLGLNARFKVAKSLENRPIAPLLDAIKGFGVTYSDHKITGKLNTDKITVDGSLSSQFVSGLMYALAVSNQKSKLTVKGKIVSKGYIDMTVSVLKAFGVSVMQDGNDYFIEKSPCRIDEYFVEGDWSGASFFLCAGAIDGSVGVKGLNINSLQKDRTILDVLSAFGAKITVNNDCVTVTRGERIPFVFNAEDCPDIVPNLAVVAAFSNGKSEIGGVSRLKIKESDRISEILKMLASAKIKAEFCEDKLIIFGGSKVSGNFTSKDHRTVMASTLLSTFLNGQSSVTDANAVKKSYPNFFDDYKLTGGNFCVDMAR